MRKDVLARKGDIVALSAPTAPIEIPYDQHFTFVVSYYL
jgi:hypothetical protein